MSKRKSHGDEWTPDLGDDPEADEQEVVTKPAPDPNEPVEWTVLTDGAVFPKNKLVMVAADVPAPKMAEDSDTVVCHIGDVVSLTTHEAYEKRSSGVALAERVTE